MTQRLSNVTKGVIFALFAAFLNGTIGVSSKLLFSYGFNAEWITFIRTILGLIFVSITIPFLQTKRKLNVKWWYTASVSFFGIFVLFYFETLAYEKTSTANVVVVLMASACVVANLAGKYLLGDKPKLNQWLGLIISVVGIATIHGLNSIPNFYGFIYSTVAGSGYGLFSVLLKKFSLQGGLILTQHLLFFGTIYLLVPTVVTPINFSLILLPQVILAFSVLAIFPSILGFFCTIKAVSYIPPAKVQLLELSEPIFATAMALFFLGEQLTIGTLIGGGFVILGIYIGNWNAF